MDKAETFVELMKEFQSVADFVTIYVKEAYSLDGYAEVDQSIMDKEYASIAGRLVAAEALVETVHPCPIYIDDVTDEARYDYGAYPDRLFVIEGNRIAYEGGRGPFYYDLKELREFLENYICNKKQN